MNLKPGISLIETTYSKWSDHKAPRLGASVAFYSLLSLAPLVVIVIAVLGLVFDRASAQNALSQQAGQMIGPRGADAIKSLLTTAQKPASGIFASVIAFITLLFSASGVFSELRDALNTIWDAKPQDQSGFAAMIKQKLFSFGMVLSVGFLLLVSLLISAALSFIGKFVGQVLPIPAPAFQAANFVVSIAIIAFLFALIFKFVPAIHIRWRDVWVGAIGTAVLFTIGKFLLGLYLGKASVGSAYSAAGSLVAVIVWVYYAAQIFFFGAEFTRVYADADAKRSERVQHAEKAEQSASAPTRSIPEPARSARQFQPEAVAARDRIPAARDQSPLPAPRPAVALPVDANSMAPNSRPSVLIAAALGFAFGRLSRRENRNRADLM